MQNILAYVSKCNNLKQGNHKKMECLSKYYVECLEYASKNNNNNNNVCDIFILESTNLKLTQIK